MATGRNCLSRVLGYDTRVRGFPQTRFNMHFLSFIVFVTDVDKQRKTNQSINPRKKKKRTIKKMATTLTVN